VFFDGFDLPSVEAERKTVYSQRHRLFGIGTIVAAPTKAARSTQLLNVEHIYLEVTYFFSGAHKEQIQGTLETYQTTVYI
jgi:hypothetical protein